METAMTNPMATFIMIVMLGAGSLILFFKQLDRESQNSVFYAGMLGIVLLIGGTLLLKVSGV
jgi:anaerobic C4-dicarboxylate transporter